MGRILVEIDVENLFDIENEQQGLLKPEQVRRLHISDALVDTGATYLCLPPDAIAALGLPFGSNERVRTAGGPKILRRFRSAQLTVMERTVETMVIEVPEGTPALLGYVPLEMLDLVADSQGQTLTTNPAHDGQWITDLY